MRLSFTAVGGGSVVGAKREMFVAKRDLPFAFQESPADGTMFVFEVGQGHDGRPQAKNCQSDTSAVPSATVGSTRQCGLLGKVEGLPDGVFGVDGALLEGEMYLGFLKNYRQQSGYGFVFVPGARQDIFVSRRELPVDFQEGSMNSEPFAFTVGRGHDGRQQATKLRWLGGVAGIPSLEEATTRASSSCSYKPDGQIGSEGDLQEGQRYLGYLKSYRFDSGYGFLSVPGASRDVFVSRRHLPSELQDGEPNGLAFVFEVCRGNDGRQQARQCSWAGGMGIGADGSMVGVETLMPQPRGSVAACTGAASGSCVAGTGWCAALPSEGRAPSSARGSVATCTASSSPGVRGIIAASSGISASGVDQCVSQTSATAVQVASLRSEQAAPTDALEALRALEALDAMEDVTEEDEQAQPANVRLKGVIVRDPAVQGGQRGLINCPELGQDVRFASHHRPQVSGDLRGVDVEFDLWVTDDERMQARQVGVSREKRKALETGETLQKRANIGTAGAKSIRA